MKSEKTILAVMLAALCCGSGLHGSEVRLLYDGKGKRMGTLEQTEHTLVMRDPSGQLVWWSSEQPPFNDPSLDIRTEEEKQEKNLLVEILKVPVVTVAVVLGLSLALVKVVTTANL